MILVAKFLKKQWAMNLILIVEILLSIIMLSELLVFIYNRVDHQRAAAELQNDHLLVCSLFEYYQDEEESIVSAMQADPEIEKVGKMESLLCVWNGQHIKFLSYNEALLRMYAPKLSSGVWLTECQAEGNACPAIVSADVGLTVGQHAEILVQNQPVEIVVQGVLALPTQYLSVAGMSQSVESFIQQDSVIVVAKKALIDANQIQYHALNMSSNLFLLTNASMDVVSSRYGKYGYMQRINDMIRRYHEESWKLIEGEMLLFGLFLVLSVIVALSIEVIHSINCRKNYTIYYLLGMQWKLCAWIESARHVVVILLTVGATVLMDHYGMLRTSWMSAQRHQVFYGVLVGYLIALLFGTSAVFIWNLLHNDISLSLRNLHGGD